jgi:hypothetical protein
VRSVAERYAVAAFAFMAAAVWLGVGLTHGFACLLVFVLAVQAVRLYQRRSEARDRAGASSRDRRSRSERVPAEERSASSRRRPTSGRPSSSGLLYDGDRQEPGWPVAGEAAW